LGYAVVSRLSRAGSTQSEAVLHVGCVIATFLPISTSQRQQCGKRVGDSGAQL